MAVFNYKGVDTTGRSVKGMRDASSAKELKGLLKKEGVYVTDIDQLAGAGQTEKEGSGGIRIDISARVTAEDIEVATRQLATLTRAGIPLVDSIQALVDQVEKPALKTTFTQIRERISEGQSLSDSLAAFPKYFSNIYVNMVNAGEQSGTLELVLSRLADFMQAQRRIRQSVLGAVIYPIVLAVIGVLILSIMMLVVVPKVTAIFEDFGQVLPWYTRALIALSNAFRSWLFWLLFLPTAGMGTYLFIRWKATSDGRKKWHEFVLRIPQIGHLALHVAIGRFASTLGTMLASGVPMLSALEITRHVINNAVLEGVLDRAIVAVREGENLHRPLEASGRFPPLVCKMIATGEQSGQLEEMLRNVSEFYDEQTNARVQILTRILEPVMILVMGGSAGIITFCILMPLLKIHQFAG